MAERRVVGGVGEFGLIGRVRRLAASATSASGRSEWVVGIGDDAAVLRPRASEDLVVSADTLVEGVHFRFDTQVASRVGRRALAVNLSDLAAMGARPIGCTLAVAMPGDLPLAHFDAMVRGFVREADTFGCPLVGGNLSRASEVSLAVTVFGGVPRGRALRRRGLRAGDRLYVTGTLGGAALERARGGRIQRVPAPRLSVGQALVRSRKCRACIDVSDGLVADLGHLLAEAGLGARLDLEQLPLARGLRSTCARLGRDPWEIALAGGEDYELLFALAASTPLSQVVPPRLEVPVSEIGWVTARPGIEGLPASWRGDSGGWRHF